MKGPSNISVRLDLFEDKNNTSDKSEQNLEMKSNSDENHMFKWNELEQMNRQVVFINPEWDEIEEEKSGIPAILNGITPTKSVSPQPTEFVATDSESISSVTVSLDELVDESEEIVTVVAEPEQTVVQGDLAPLTAQYSDAKSQKIFSNGAENRNWKDPETVKMESEFTAQQIIKIAKNKSIINSNESTKKYETMEPNKLIKASCYVVQNGKVTKPFYIVKNPSLRSDIIYRGDNKVDDLSRSKSTKSLDSSAVSDELKNLLPLGRQSAGKKKENFQEAQFSKPNRNQDYIRIIEHPAKEKRVVVGKPRDAKFKSDANLKKPMDDGMKKFKKNLATNSKNNSGESEDLMWLLDFKLDDLFSESSLPALSHLDDSLEYTEFPGKIVNIPGSTSNIKVAEGDSMAGCQTETTANKSNKSSNCKTGQKQQQQQQQKLESKAESSITGRTFNDLKYSENRKPPFTYTELIECALQEKGPLTVSEIYHWISETFPYYKSWDDRWKNSVRHNLSINPYFRKGTKARQGSGHLWTVNKSDDNSKINSWKRQRFHEFEEFNKRLRLAGEVEKHESSSECVSSSKMMDETELATASIEDKENRKLHKDVLMAACVDNNLISASNVSLEQSAEEILSGVKKTVEVQYLEPVKSSSPCENDFLNPISKEILMGECGLLNQIELNLTAETGEHLSIVDDMTDSEHIFGISDELNFQYDISNHPPQLLSLAK
ncbi:UNVERIFIED_CONTAM: hypothetical protein PYX00_006044 [Menopon gallinae]|uniref:Fork-head domain-containing protein n=1 Tax=Menopon gallinae TaxID=328185 RepID=A0AAW2HUY4_9NEOP